MKRIDQVYKKLKELYSGIGVSAQTLADELNLSRANVSSDLNRLCQEGKVEKSSGRPVLFFPSQSGEEDEHEENTLDRFAAKNQSLYSAVEQAKAAVLYPPRGMHILILGETGVGKSMFAGLVHKYAVEMGRMDEKSPFVTFNCADYANNPELLISQLFGSKKGAYTGADADREGLIEKANGGIFFLDEVHRLPPEGQEMFFTFMDRGTFRRLGETDVERSANVLIISATTENPDSVLLKTFTRRIPMVIHIPGLAERSLEERFDLISGFFIEESFRLNGEIMVSVNSMRSFLSYNCPNNVGQLKTDIQLACAKAYSDFISRRKDVIKINSTDLPGYIREGLYKETEHRQIWNKLIGVNKRYCIFNKGEKDIFIDNKKDEENIYDMINQRVQELRIKGIHGEDLERVMEKDIEEYFKKYMYDLNKPAGESGLANVIEPEIIKVIEEVTRYCEEALNRKLDQKVYYGMAVHIASAIDRIRRNKRIINPQLNKVRLKYSREFAVALDCIQIMERQLDITIPIDEAGFLAMFFVYDNWTVEDKSENVRVIIIAHGYSTATSMAEVANKLLGVKYATGINAPLDENPQQVFARLKEYLKEEGITQDILLLVDMGSLTTFAQRLEQEAGIRAKVIPLVSTLHVIEATRKATMGHSLEEVYRDTLNVNTFMENESDSRSKGNASRKLAIVTICTTGEGSAVAIKNFLEGHLEFDSNILEIIPVNLVGKENIGIRLKEMAREKEIICIVSSFSIDTELPQFGLDEVLGLRALKKIQGIADIRSTYLKMGHTLKNQLKNVDGEEVFKEIKKFINTIETGTGIKLDPDMLIGVTLHIGCMIDRLLGNESLVEFEDKNIYISENLKLYNSVRDASEILSQKYKVNISEDELCYIMKFFIYKSIEEN